MSLHGPKLERKQLLLGRLVDIGAELFAWSTAVSRAQSYLEDGTRSQEEVGRALELARLQGVLSREVIRQSFSGLFAHEDKSHKRVTSSLMENGLTTPLSE